MMLRGKYLAKKNGGVAFERFADDGSFSVLRRGVIFEKSNNINVFLHNGENGFNRDSTFTSFSVSSAFTAKAHIATLPPIARPGVLDLPVFHAMVLTVAYNGDGVVDIGPAASRGQDAFVIELHRICVGFNCDRHRALCHRFPQRDLVVPNHDTIVTNF